MSQPDYKKQVMESPDVLIGFSCDPYVFRFALNRSVLNTRSLNWGTGTGYGSTAAFDCKGTWYGFIKSISPIRQSVGPSVFSKIVTSEVKITIARVNHPVIDNFLKAVESTDGFSDFEYYVPIMVCERNKPPDPDTDTLYVGVISPYSVVCTPDTIELTLKDPFEGNLKRNVLQTYEAPDYPDIDFGWIDREIPRPYGDWGDFDYEDHRQYGFEVPMVNAADVTVETPAWPIFRVGMFGEGVEADFNMIVDTGIPQMIDQFAKVWAFWADGTAYDIWRVRAPKDDTGYLLTEGYVQGVRSIREEITGETTRDFRLPGVTLGVGNRVKIHTHGGDPDPDGGGFLLIQEIKGTDELNEEWWEIHTKTDMGGGDYDIELNYKNGIATIYNGSNFTPWTSGGQTSTYIPIYKPAEPQGSRDTDTELFRFWIPDSAYDHSFFRRSQQAPSTAPMENPVEIIYDLLYNCAGINNPLFYDVSWWQTYEYFDGIISSRRYIRDQMTVKEAVEEICHDFGLMVFVHAGKWYCRLNRIHSQSSAFVRKRLFPKDVKKGSVRFPFDPGREAIPYDWGVRVYYEYDQGEQVFTDEELMSIGKKGSDAQFSKEQLPTQSDKFIIPGLSFDGDTFYSTYAYPTSTSTDKTKVIKLKWISDEDLAKGICLVFARALNASLDSAAGNQGFEAAVIKRTIDPTYKIGDIHRYYPKFIDRDTYYDFQVYEREIDLKNLVVKEKGYAVRITGD